MNLFFKSYKFYLFFFLTGILQGAPLQGQDAREQFSLSPEMIEFEIPSKFNRTPSTSFCRNNNGVYFFGKQDGILIIDDNDIQFFPSGDPVFIARDFQDKIVYLTANDFGFVQYSRTEQPKLLSRMNMLVKHFPDFLPEGMHASDSATFLLTSEGVFVLSPEKAEHFFFNRKQVSLYSTGTEVYLRVNSMGMFRWNGAKFTIIADERSFKGRIISGLMDLNGRTAILFRDKTTMLLPEKNQDADKTEILPENELLPENEAESVFRKNYTQLFHLFHDLYLGQDVSGNLTFLTASENGFEILPQYSNIPSLPVTSVFVDMFNDIWVLSDFSLYKLEYPSNAYTLNLSRQLGRSLLSSAYHDDYIYLATSKGLFQLKENENNLFDLSRLSSDDNGYFHTVKSEQNLTIATGSSGTYLVKNNTIDKILDVNFSSVIILDSSTFLGCQKLGFYTVSDENGTWTEKLLDSTITGILSLTYFDDSYYFVADHHSLYQVDKGQVNTVHTGLSDDHRINKALTYAGQLILLTPSGLYAWDSISGSFQEVQLSSLQVKLLSSDMIYGNKDHLWSVARDESGGSTIWKLEKEAAQTPYFEIMAKQAFGQVVDIDEVGTDLWITGNKMLLRLSANPVKGNQPNQLAIKSVIAFVNDPSNESSVIHSHDAIKFRKQHIVFHLNNLRYQKAPYPYYRFRIDHLQKEWSEWNRNNNIVLDHPREGSYTFQAQSISSFGQLSDPVSFEFTITPPFYRTWLAYILYVLLLFAVAFLIYKWRLLSLKRVEYKLEERIKERMKAVLTEKEKSDKLVADLFPKGTAEELKNQGRAKSKKFEMVTVLFSDIQGFTRIAEEMNPEVLIDELDKFFFHFDSVVDKYNIEKIKTIGDAYMAAGGIPIKNSSNPVEVVLAGLEMQQYMNDLKKKKANIWDLRIGIHTGPVISGVVGHKKLSYDIWGDTVNTASRMESSGEGGKVNISGITYSYVKDFFLCEYRGKLPVKYKGNIDMYFVTGLRPELSVDLHGIPNRRFFIKLQMLKLTDIEERVLEMISSNMSLNLHFHKKNYIQRVYHQAELLGRSENISDDDLLMVQTASIMLFSGLSETYDNFENKSIEISREILPEFGYDEKQIDRICNLILAVKEPFSPQNTLESVVIDASMEYLGRSDYLTQVKLLYLEKKNVYSDLSREKFVREQEQLIHAFNFHTLAAQRLREISAEKQLENLKSWK